MLNIKLMSVQRKKKSQQVNATMVYRPTKYSTRFLGLKTLHAVLTGGCGEEMNSFLERCGGLPEDEVFWTDNPGQQESRGQIRCPLI